MKAFAKTIGTVGGAGPMASALTQLHQPIVLKRLACIQCLCFLQILAFL